MHFVNDYTHFRAYKTEEKNRENTLRFGRITGNTPAAKRKVKRKILPNRKG